MEKIASKNNVLVKNISAKNRLRKLFWLLIYQCYYRHKVTSGLPFVIYYHRINRNKEKNNLQDFYNKNISIKENLFEKQIKYLKNTAQIITLEQFMLQYRKKKERIASVLITFDDGYIDNYTYAYPILKKYNVPATIFITTDMIGENNTFWWDEIYNIIVGSKDVTVYKQIIEKYELAVVMKEELYQKNERYLENIADKIIIEITEKIKFLDENERWAAIDELRTVAGYVSKKSYEREFMNWDEIKEMSENGITFGSHTCSHINTKVVSDIKLKNELMKSKQKIEHMIKRKIDTFSYPYGIVDGRRCPSMLKECGYKMGFATYRYGKYGSRWAAKRIPIKEQNSIGIFSEFSQSLFEMEYKGYLKEIINYIKLKMNK